MTDAYGGYATTIEMVERHLGFVDVMLRDRPDVLAYRLWGHRTLDGCYGDPVDSQVGGSGPDALFDVARSATFRSRSIILRGVGTVGESHRGMARAYFNPDDYALPTTNIAPDSDQAYIRVQERTVTSQGNLAASGILTITAGAAQVGAFIIMGPGGPVSFDGIILARAAGSQDFNTAVSDADAASELIAAINDPVTQALLLAGDPVGVTVAASAGAAANEVVLTASVNTTVGNTVPITGGAAPFTVSGATLTGGGDSFATVQGTLNNGAPVLGPIYLLPRPGFMNTNLPSLTFTGTAPANTGAVPGEVSPVNVDGQLPNPMNIVLPRASDEITVNNLQAAGGVNLLISLSLGMPMVEVEPQKSFVLADGGIKSVVVASADNGGGGAVAPTFTAWASIYSGATR
jgi:hypothetical protein